LLLCLSLQLAACAHLSVEQKKLAGDYAAQARSSVIDCAGNDCEIASPLRDLGDAAYAASSPGQPKHSLILLDRGQDSLLARVHLIRSARHSVDLQTFHFERDDAGRVVLDALMAAARRGVKVRLLMDQLSGLADPALQAKLAGFHDNFQLRVYNPTFGHARTRPLQWLGGIVFEFRDFNKRMHNKLMLVDGRVAIIGGRNVQNEYFDWNDRYDYRDRDLLVAGPVTEAMQDNFTAFWSDRRTIAAEQLKDVASVLIRNRGPPPGADPPASPRVRAMAAAADNGADVVARLSPYLFQVGQVEFFADVPGKHDDAAQHRNDASQALLSLVGDTERELLLETPYLVLSRPARMLFRDLHQRRAPPQVLVSTNSLAATDAFPVYAMSHKYKRLYLRELGFEIHEFKPFPADAPIDLAAVGADPGDVDMQGFTKPFGSGRGPVPLKRAGVRIGLHAKSMVIDERVGIVGSHNFDPRSTDYNTESLVVVRDPAFAQALATSIRGDMAPENAWTIAPRARIPILWGLNYNLGKLSEKLPIFDLWPLPYATSYELKPGCAPLSPNDPKFHDCYQWVGDFPEVNLSLKSVYTRIITVFGAGLIPIL
jgi:phosphatidylserine/phosphatidylglycerophosphate/cardiolipin synthase-like enzyme